MQKEENRLFIVYKNNYFAIHMTQRRVNLQRPVIQNNSVINEENNKEKVKFNCF